MGKGELAMHPVMDFERSVGDIDPKAPATMLTRVCAKFRRCGPVKSTVLFGRHVRDRVIDRCLNIATPYPHRRPYNLATHFRDAVPNEPLDYLLLRRFMQPERLNDSDIVFDIGCGMGRVLCMFARRPVRKCVGIEFDATLVRVARANAQRLLGRRCEIEVRCGDAIDADYSGGTVYWMYNPFGPCTIRTVLRRIEDTLIAAPRQIQIAYVNPLHGAVFAEFPWLRCVSQDKSAFYGTYGARYWTNADSPIRWRVRPRSGAGFQGRRNFTHRQCGTSGDGNVARPAAIQSSVRGIVPGQDRSPRIRRTKAMATPNGYVIDIVEEDRWDALVQKFDQFTVFHMMPWMQAVASTFDLSVVLTAVLSAGVCVAVWPAFEMRRGPFRVMGSPLPGWSTAYLGPLFASKIDVAGVLSAFMDHSRFRRPAYFACKVLDQRAPVDLMAHGFSVVLKYDTYRLDLNRHEDELWSNLRRECRNHVRKAQKSGVETRWEADGSFLDEFWSMSVETFAKANVKPTYNRRLIGEIWRRLHAAGQVQALSAFHQNERVATALLLEDGHTRYYWGGASYLRFRHLSAHNLLQWEAIRDARARGMHTYDFISTTGGPGTFKQSFGPAKVPIATHWERCSSRLVGLLKNLYARRLRRRQAVSTSVAGIPENTGILTATAEGS